MFEKKKNLHAELFFRNLGFYKLLSTSWQYFIDSPCFIVQFLCLSVVLDGKVHVVTECKREY